MYREPPLQEEEALAAQIDIELEFEVTYWSRRFGVTKAALRTAIARVGNQAAAVRAALMPRQRMVA